MGRATPQKIRRYYVQWFAFCSATSDILFHTQLSQVSLVTPFSLRSPRWLLYDAEISYKHYKTNLQSALRYL